MPLSLYPDPRTPGPWGGCWLAKGPFPSPEISALVKW